MQGRAEGKLRGGIRVSGLTSERTPERETVMVDTPLRGVPGWTDEHVERLAQAWITTAEQVVAISATPGGLRSLAEQLAASEDEARPLVEAARNALQPTVRAEMEGWSIRVSTDSACLDVRRTIEARRSRPGARGGGTPA